MPPHYCFRTLTHIFQQLMWSTQNEKTELITQKSHLKRRLFKAFWSECGDSNPGPPAPKPPALPTALIPDFWLLSFCARCGQTCGQVVFLTTSTCGGSVCIAGVSRDCGHSVFRLEGGAARSQSRRATNCAIPGYSVYLSGWSYSPKPGAIPTSLYPDTFSVYHSCGWKGRENFWFT